MRVLDKQKALVKLEDAGMDSKSYQKLITGLNAPYGIILVTGPTGSGKTTTLYGALNELRNVEDKVITVEDPVEYRMNLIQQVQVNPKVGLSFADALRSILRQDPDVVMIGEIRDEETASIAVRAALTGHLVFSTLHTNSAAATISRLVDMGIEPFLISSSLLGILAQRLVRKLCPTCKVEDSLAEEFAKDYDLPKDALIYKAVGCEACNYSGYSGRQSIGELLVMDDTVKELLKTTTDEHSIKEALQHRGLKTIATELKEMLLRGETSLQEAIRVGLGHD
jgi:general secretion pathway protein E